MFIGGGDHFPASAAYKCLGVHILKKAYVDFKCTSVGDYARFTLFQFHSNRAIQTSVRMELK